MKTSVMLPVGRAQFRRVMRDESGKALLDKGGAERVLVFSPGQALDLTPEELEVVRNDIGNVLCIAKGDGKGKAVAKPDGNATAKFADETKAMREGKREKSQDAPAPAKTAFAPRPAPVAKDIETKGK